MEALPEMQQIFGDADWTFQHDGATSHSDKKTNEWLASNVPHYIPSGPKGEWPAKSPDLNWIENMWSIVAWRVSEGKVPGTLSTLKQKLKRVWSQIPDETLQQCASGMPERLREVIKKKGCALPNNFFTKRVFCFCLRFVWLSGSLWVLWWGQTSVSSAIILHGLVQRR